MTHAYHEMYLNSAMNCLASMFDFAINDFGIPGSDFAEMFAASETARRMEAGEAKYLIGMSGEEVALRVIEETTGITPEADITLRYNRTPDHWCGYVICYYQWLRAISYKELFGILSYEEIGALYQTLHEADISKFAEVMDEKRASANRETNLKRIRVRFGCSQSRLAKLSGVSLRSIQMYEQRNKDINKSQLGTVIRLSKVLGCHAEDLYES